VRRNGLELLIDSFVFVFEMLRRKSAISRLVQVTRSDEDDLKGKVDARTSSIDLIHTYIFVNYYQDIA
jgi:hypothetical protein